MTFRVVIPARLGSTRLPGKVLVPLAGKPLLAHVFERAVESGASDVWVATDSGQVLQAAKDFGAQAALTRADHRSGTDRLAELALREQWPEDDIVVNLQGDEPLMPPALIAQVAGALHEYPHADIATACVPIHEPAEYFDHNAVKVVRDAHGFALYFSRAPIPYWRDGDAGELPTAGALRHLGIYAYRVASLQRFSAAEPAPLEHCESLEQLRALSMGMRLFVTEAEQVPGPGVDTENDLRRVEKILSGKQQP